MSYVKDDGVGVGQLGPVRRRSALPGTWTLLPKWHLAESERPVATLVEIGPQQNGFRRCRLRRLRRGRWLLFGRDRFVGVRVPGADGEYYRRQEAGAVRNQGYLDARQHGYFVPSLRPRAENGYRYERGCGGAGSIAFEFSAAYEVDLLEE